MRAGSARGRSGRSPTRRGRRRRWASSIFVMPQTLTRVMRSMVAERASGSGKGRPSSGGSSPPWGTDARVERLAAARPARPTPSCGRRRGSTRSRSRRRACRSRIASATSAFRAISCPSTIDDDVAADLQRPGRSRSGRRGDRRRRREPLFTTSWISAPSSTGRFEVLRVLLGDGGGRDAEIGALDLPVLLELGHDLLGGVDRNGEADPDRSVRAAGRDLRVDPDDLAARVDERPAGIARVDRRIRLDDVVDLEVVGSADLALERRHDARGDRAVVAERVADRDHRVADSHAGSSHRARAA